jgi:hypothetical protein
MKWIMAALLMWAAMLLAIPALAAGSYGYALGVLAVLIAGCAIQRGGPQSGATDLLLVGHAAMSVSALFIGVHPSFAVVALCLYLFAWDTEHRFGNTPRAAAACDAERRFIVNMLTRSVLPSFAVGLLLTAFFYVPISLTYGIGLGLSVAALVMIAAFVRLARTRYRESD